MINMNIKNENKNEEIMNNKNKRISYLIPLNASFEKNNFFVKKGKDYKEKKKSISMRQIFDEDKKIKLNENKNNNIEISKTKNSNIEANKLNTCIIGYDSEKPSEKNNKLANSMFLKKNSKSKSKSNEESSYRMEKLLEKNSKNESTFDKQEKFIEFYINDNKKNIIYKLHDNTITTTKYNLLTFIPKGLLFQFCRLSNVYFLFTAIIQSIPLISPLTSVTAIIPLIFVLGISLIREALEDLVRHNYDNLNNQEEVIVLRKNKFVKSTSQTLKHGEIILVYENKSIPADMIVIDSGFSEGICYVETSSLDGEKTLKLKVANKYTKGFFSNDIKENKGIEKYFHYSQYSLSGAVKINEPNIDLNYINGSIHVIFNKKECKIDETIIVSTAEFLLKGSILKNTNWIIGIVAYTGMKNKIILNSKKPRMKMSKIEKTLNYFLLFVFIFLILLCISCSILHHFEYLSKKHFYDNFIILKDNPNIESFICFFTYFLLLNTLIPISLVVSTEIIKIIQGIIIKWDILLYSKSRHCFCDAKSVSIIEELGNVNFIFSDKTGTITKNQLEFKYCIIENKFYEYIKSIRKRQKSSFHLKDNNLKLIKNKKSNMLESNIMNNSKNELLSKLNINSNFDKNLFINNAHDNGSLNEQNNNIFKNKKVHSTKIIPKRNKNSNNNIPIINNKISEENEKTNSLNTKSINSYRSNDIVYNYNQNEINRKYKLNKLSNNFEKIYQKHPKNSTIIELKNEDNFNNEPKIKIIPFGEGYFTDPNNNSFLKSISSEEESEINYIHEFWKALAITNECMVKEEKGQIRYMGTSPDDLELVKAAMNQGYKLIETSIKAKIVRIGGKDYSFEILRVLGFSSERKRMSIIIKDEFGIKLYIKGADCEITKRLSKKSRKSESYDIITNGLLEYSKNGFRTLMVAFRRIKQEDYNFWINKLHEDELNMQNKQKLIERLYDIIENNLTLIGGTVVEDKLQDKVPETIKDLRAAGIKIWVLTGDKLNTAENIGYSCNLLSKEQKLFILKLMPGDDERKVRIDPYREMTEFFIEFQKFVDNLVKKYNLDLKYDLCLSECESQNMEEMRSKKSNLSNKSKIIDFEIFKYLIDKKLLEPFSIIIEAPILAGLFKDYEWTENFLGIAYYSNTVICCRVSPSQKRQVVQKIKNFDSKAVTLAIGDGGNDVSMIMEANIGIGIYGEEGMSAAQSSDFSIGEFKMLKRLLFVHGRTYLYCISKMILYFFYKNFVFSLIQFYFSFLCLGSGQTFVDDWYITFYNLIFTALPLGISALTDSDIDLNNSKKAKQNLPLLYKENRDNYKIFSLGRFIITLIKGIFISFFIFISCCIKQILTLQGHFANIWFLSIKTIICVLFVVSANLLINNYFIVIYLPLSIFITTYLIFFIFLILNHYGLLFKFNSKATIFPSLTSPILYLTLFLVSCFSIVIDYSFKLFELFFSNSLSSKIILNESLKGKRKSSIRIFNIGTRSYSHNRIKIRKNSAYPLKSKNNYMTKYTLSNKNVLIKNNGQTNLISKFNNSSFDNQYKNIN